MENYSKFDECKEFMPNEDNQKFVNENNDAPRNSLLYLFIKCVWDSKDGERSGHEDQKLKHWLELQNLDVTDKNWALSPLLDIRISSRIELTDTAKSDKRLYNEITELNDKRMCASLAFKLRKVLPLLIKYEGNIHCANDKGQTILHIFLKEYSEVDKSLSKYQSSAIILLLKTLIVSGASFFTVDKYNQTPFNIATMCKNKDVLQTILSHLNINECDKYGNSALHIVAGSYIEEIDDRVNEHLDLIRALVSKGADINRKNSKGELPIHLAAEKFHVKVLQFFVDKNVEFRECTNEGETPLHFACKSVLKLKDTSRMIETVNLLIFQGCLISAANKNGYLPLHYAAEYGTVQIIEKLFEFGAAVDCRTDVTQITPLHLASKSGRLDNMSLLVQAGADVNAEDVDGTTPLFLATIFASVECIQYLIDNGADLNHRRNLSKLSVLYLLAQEQIAIEESVSETEGEQQAKKFFMSVENASNFEMSPLLLAVLSNRVDVVEIFIKRGAEINFQTCNTEWTALHVALMKNHLEIALILLVSGADANCRGGINQVTPLYLALVLDAFKKISEVYPDSVKKLEEDLRLINRINSWWPKKHDPKSDYKPFIALLIDHGADVNGYEEHSRRTLLHLATLHPDIDVMKWLLESNAFVNAQDLDGYLPLHNILKYGSGNGLKLLLEFGADINDDVTSKLIVSRETELEDFFDEHTYIRYRLAGIDLRIGKSNENIREIIIQHAIKLKTVSLPVAAFYLPLIRKSAFNYFHNECIEEMVNPPAFFFVDDIPLYTFLHSNARRQRVFVKKISESYESLKYNFPHYITLIKAACRSTVQRKPLVEAAMIAWNHIGTFRLPFEIIESILQYLSNRDLDCLALSALKTAALDKK